MQALLQAYMQALGNICQGVYRRADLMAIDKAQDNFYPKTRKGESVVQKATSVQYEILNHFEM